MRSIHQYAISLRRRLLAKGFALKKLSKSDGFSPAHKNEFFRNETLKLKGDDSKAIVNFQQLRSETNEEIFYWLRT